MSLKGKQRLLTSSREVCKLLDIAPGSLSLMASIAGVKPKQLVVRGRNTNFYSPMDIQKLESQKRQSQ